MKNEHPEYRRKAVYIEDYATELNATIVGVFVVVILIFAGNFFDYSDPENSPVIISYIILFRAVAAVWCYRIADRLNRDRSGWAFFAFVAPIIALIWIGLCKKIKYEVYFKTPLTPEKQYMKLKKDGVRFIGQKRYSEASEVYGYIVANLPHVNEDQQILDEIHKRLQTG